jgi:hypothetical protein
MAMCTKTMNAVPAAVWQTSNTIVATCSSSNSSTVKIGSCRHLGGLRLSGAGLRSSASSLSNVQLRGHSTFVVRAEEGVTDKVKDAAGSVASKVKDTANYAKDKVQNAAGTVTDTAKDVASDFQGKAEQAGDKASEAGKDLEGKTKSAANEATRQTENLAVRAAIRLFLVSGLISFLVICVAMSSVSIARPTQQNRPRRSSYIPGSPPVIDLFRLCFGIIITSDNPHILNQRLVIS